MSSFRRVGRGAEASSCGTKAPLLTASTGVKPWTGGIHLTSVGVTDLDNLLGGGQPLGTCMLLQEDRWNRDLSVSLLKYWCAEAISQDQHLIIPVGEEMNQPFTMPRSEPLDIRKPRKREIEDLLLSLPRNLHWAKQEKAEHTNHQSTNLGILDEDDSDEKAEEDLEIAWQYKKSVQQERLAQPLSQKKTTSGGSNVFCHSYDLSGRLADQATIDPSKYIATIKSVEPVAVTNCGVKLFHELVSLLGSKDGKPMRLLLYRPEVDILASALPLLLSYIRRRSLPVVLLVHATPSNDFKSWSKLSTACDVVLKTEGFSSRRAYPPPPEFRLLQGILTFSKLTTLTAATATGGGFFGDISVSKRPAAFIYGLKRDRRKLHISLLHIPPEDYAQGGGSVGSGVRSGGGKAPEKKSTGLGCSSNISGSALDF
eukprot:scaffold26900_cov117-Cylindrotheca_fusiformis.AAC.2